MRGMKPLLYFLLLIAPKVLINLNTRSILPAYLMTNLTL